jgi:RNA-directed DNA polymerase
MAVERRHLINSNVSNNMGGRGEMIKTPINLQDLRRKIYIKAKAEKQHRFWGLYIHICKLETLWKAYQLARKNKGAPGIDGITFEIIEEGGLIDYLQDIQNELVNGNYKPQRAKEVAIPKPDGKGERILKIPTIRDRIVEGAVKLILEPIFEADFQDGSYGYRPKRKASQAINKVSKAIVRKKTQVINIDMRSYFDTVRHDILLGKVAERIQDKQVLHLIKLILKAGGKRGLRQGGVLSPVLSNVFLNAVDIMLERAKEVSKSQGYDRVEYVRWADDLIVLIDEFQKHSWLKKAVEKRLREELKKLDLTINEDKSSVIDLRKPGQTLQFLGFEFRRITTMNGKIGVLMIPKTKARINLQRKLKKIFKAKRGRSIEEVVETINPIIGGWVNYFRIGNSARCFQKVEDWVQKKVRRHLYRSKQRRGFGWKRWSREQLYCKTGLYQDYKIRYVDYPVNRSNKL